jgi:hypothetical protein
MAIGETDLMRLPARTSLRGGRRWVVLRAAGRDDLPALARLTADDELGSRRDGIENAADLVACERAFEAIDRDPAHVLLAAESDFGVVGTLELSFLPGLAARQVAGAQRPDAHSTRGDHVRRGLRRRGGRRRPARPGRGEHGGQGGCRRK